MHIRRSMANVYTTVLLFQNVWTGRNGAANWERRCLCPVVTNMKTAVVGLAIVSSYLSQVCNRLRLPISGVQSSQLIGLLEQAYHVSVQICAPHAS